MLLTLVEKVTLCHLCRYRDGPTCGVSGSSFVAHCEEGRCPAGFFDTEPVPPRRRALANAGRRPCNCNDATPVINSAN